MIMKDIKKNTNSFIYFIENKIFNGIDSESIKWWSNYASQKTFSSENEARQWLFDRLEFGDKTSPFENWINGTEYNKLFSEQMPLYKSGKSWKIGKRIRKDNRLKLKNLKIKRPDLYELNQIAQANGESDYVLHPVKWIRIDFNKNDYYLTNPSELQRIEKLAEQIKQNNWIEAIVYDYNKGYIIEGQHRSRAMYIMGFKSVPGIGIEYYE